MGKEERRGKGGQLEEEGSGLPCLDRQPWQHPIGSKTSGRRWHLPLGLGADLEPGNIIQVSVLGVAGHGGRVGWAAPLPRLSPPQRR